MYILEADQIKLSYGESVILDGISFSVNQRDRIGVVGVNGAGKTTLFDILSGENTSYSGNVFISKGKTLGYLHQISDIDSSSSVFDSALEVFSDLVRLEKKLGELQKKMQDDYSDSLINEYSRLESDFARRGGYEFRKKAKGCLLGMGFDEDMLARSVNSLSGGQKTTLSLALLLLEEPDILLLDEPTNHLDIKALNWLEEKLLHIGSTVIVISHDRFFLDKITNKTLEIENGKGKLYPVSYTEYRRRKKEDREILMRHYKNQQNEIRRMEAFIEQQRRWNRERNIIAAESRQKAIDRMVKIDAPSALPKNLSFDFSEAIESGNQVLHAEKLGKSYGNKCIFSDLSFDVRKNDRLLIIGANGSGKSTLLQMIAGKIPQSSGDFEFGYNVKPGYYDQNLLLNDDLTVLEEVWNELDATHTEVRSLLNTFLFEGDDVFKKISVLSGGERARVSLAKLMQKKVNLLLLDEPTNHLDIESCEALEDAIEKFSGTVIAVSHDRYFINRLATRILEFSESPYGADTFLYEGDYEHYTDYIAKRSEKEKEARGSAQSLGRAAFEASKQDKRERQMLKKKKASIEAELERSEARIAEIDKECEASASDYKLLQGLYEEKEALLKRCDELTEQWLEIDI